MHPLLGMEKMGNSAITDYALNRKQIHFQVN
jgi:hypothetical protein